VSQAVIDHLSKTFSPSF